MAHVFVRRPRKLVALSAVVLFASLLFAPGASATETAQPTLLAPADLTATYRSGGVDLGWTRWNPSSSVTGWEYRTSTVEDDLADATWTAMSGLAGTARVAEGLTAATTHYFQVRAVNASSSSPASDTASVLLGDAPARLPGFSATTGGSSRAWVSGSWPTGTTYEAGVQLQARFAEDPTGQTSTDWVTIGSTTWTNASNAKTGIHGWLGTAPNNTVLRIEGRAVFGGVAGPARRVSLDTYSLTPLSLDGEGVGSTSVRLRWTEVNDGYTSTSYEYRYVTDGGDIDTATWIATNGSYVGAHTWTHVVHGLETNVWYDFEVRSAAGDRRSGAASATARPYARTVAPAPAGLAAFADQTDPREVRITWDSPYPGDVPGDEKMILWQFRWRKGNEPWPAFAFHPIFNHGDGTHTEALFRDFYGSAWKDGEQVYAGGPFEPGATYTIQIRILNEFGHSGWSNTATVTMPPLGGTQDYNVKMLLLTGDLTSVAGVKSALKIADRPGNPCWDIDVTLPHGSADSSVIAAAAPVREYCWYGELSADEPYIDGDGSVHNFRSGHRYYWQITPGTIYGTVAETDTYKVEMTRINGDRSTVDGVKAADKVQVNAGGACDDITVTVPEGSADSAILTAADAISTCHSINTGSRYIDADGEVHNFQSGKRAYWMITAVEDDDNDDDGDEVVDPVVVEDIDTYKVEMTRINGDRSTVNGVKAADKVQVNAGGACDDITVTVPEGSDDSAILTAADAISTCHSINTGSRYIDADGEVHNFQSGKRTYWMVTAVEDDDDDDVDPVDPVIVEETEIFKVIYIQVSYGNVGATATLEKLKNAQKVQIWRGHACYDLVVEVPVGSDDSVILAAADEQSTCHSITTESRYIDADNEIHNFVPNKSHYWRIVRRDG